MCEYCFGGNEKGILFYECMLFNWGYICPTPDLPCPFKDAFDPIGGEIDA
jgi:hypothetical protein